MTIQYYVGGKIVGLEADTKPTSVPANTTFIESDTFTEFIFDGVATWNQIGLPLITGGWVEVGRTTLGATGDIITVSDLPNKRYYMILADTLATGNVTQRMRLGSLGTVDTGSNYANRENQNGGTDFAGASEAFIRTGSTHDINGMLVSYLANVSNKEKLGMVWANENFTAGPGTAPDRAESVFKQAQASNPVTDVRVYNDQAGSYLTDSEVVVLAWDPADTHTGNFWEELASVDLSGGVASSISSGIFTAKKYIWIQYLIKGHTDVSSFDGYLRFGNTTIDSGNNYAWREESNGAADSTGTTTNRILSQTGFLASGQTMFGNFFIINNTSNEKLVTGKIGGGAASGPGTSPNRRESLGKWTDTSNQFDIVEIGRQSGSGNFATATTLKVWGSD